MIQVREIAGFPYGLGLLKGFWIQGQGSVIYRDLCHFFESAWIRPRRTDARGLSAPNRHSYVVTFAWNCTRECLKRPVQRWSGC